MDTGVNVQYMDTGVNVKGLNPLQLPLARLKTRPTVPVAPPKRKGTTTLAQRQDSGIG